MSPGSSFLREGHNLELPKTKTTVSEFRKQPGCSLRINEQVFSEKIKKKIK
jgi:hypothetical protein